MDLLGLCEGVVELSCTYFGKNGGIPVTLEKFKNKYTLGIDGVPVSERDINDLMEKLIYYKGKDLIPIINCTDTGIRVSWD